MAVTLEWVRDNYDTNKNRYIEKDETAKAVNDYLLTNTITKEQYIAVQAAYEKQTQLPPYTTPPPTTARGQIVSIDPPPSAKHNERAVVNVTIKNIGGSDGSFKVQVNVTASYTKLISPGNTAVFAVHALTPSTGTSATFTLKCIIDGTVDATKTFTITLTPPPTTVTLEWIRDRYDANKDSYIDKSETAKALNDYLSAKTITKEQYDAVQLAYDNQTLLPAYPTPPVNGDIDPDLTTPDVRSLEAGKYNITITKSGYNTVYATITVSSAGQVSCTDAVCLASGYPRVEASVTSVKVYMAAAAPPTIAKCTWIATKDTSKVAFISELILAYNHIPDLTFPVLSKEISDGILMYNNLGTPQTLWGC